MEDINSKYIKWIYPKRFILIDNKDGLDIYPLDESVYRGWYWAEVSGGIEHYFKKYNGYPIPNCYASELLGKTVTLSEDKVHYDRPIGMDGNIYTKAIYGFQSEDFYNKIMKEVDDYEEFMHKVNEIKESITHFGIEVHKATYVIENIYRAHFEDEVNEILPSWKKILISSKKILEMSPLLKEHDGIKWYRDMAEYLLEEMPVFECKQIL